MSVAREQEVNWVLFQRENLMWGFMGLEVVGNEGQGNFECQFSSLIGLRQ